jgi:hypothetical protein
MQPQSLPLSERTSSPERSDVRRLLGVTAWVEGTSERSRLASPTFSPSTSHGSSAAERARCVVGQAVLFIVPASMST